MQRLSTSHCYPNMTEFVINGLATDGGQTREADSDAAGTPTPDDGTSAVRTLTDPAALADHDDVDYVTERFDEDRPFRDAAVAGRAIVGLTNAAGDVLLFEHDEQPPILPTCRVDPGDDWAAVGRGTVDDVPGLSIELQRVERVRALDYDVDGESGTNYYVVFRAAVAGDGTAPSEPTVDDQGWDAGWYDAVPDDVPTDDLAEDIRLFLD